MATRNPDSLDRLSQADLIDVVRELIGEVGRLRAENEKFGVALTQLKAEHQAVKDELARLKKLPPSSPQKPASPTRKLPGFTNFCTIKRYRARAARNSYNAIVFHLPRTTRSKSIDPQCLSMANS